MGYSTRTSKLNLLIQRGCFTRSQVQFVLAALFAAACSGAMAKEYSLEGEHVVIHNVAGAAMLTAATTDAVVVDVNIQGPGADRISVEVDEDVRNKTLRVRYPEERIAYGGVPTGATVSISNHADGKLQVVAPGDGGFEGWADLAIAVPPGQRLSLHLVAGAITVTNVDGEVALHNTFGTIRADDSAGTLSVNSRSGDVTVEQFGGDGTMDKRSGDVETDEAGTDSLFLRTTSGAVRLAKLDTRDIVVRTSSGRVQSTDIRATSLSMDTTSGDIVLGSVTGDSAELDSSSGDVRGSGFHVDSLVVDTTSGNVEFEGLAAPRIRVDTSSGDVDLELASDVQHLWIDTTSGDVDLRLPEGVGAMVDIDTTSGEVELAVPLAETTTRRNDVRGKLGDGRGRIDIDTSSGSVRFLEG